jgi:gamma-glutamylcysteine synthetase
VSEKRVTVVEPVRVKLTKDEKLEAAKDLVEVLAAKDEKEAEAAASRKRFKAELDELSKTAYNLRAAVSTGLMVRELEVDYVFDFANSAVSSYRTDTGEQLEAPRAITQTERLRFAQEEL